MKNYNISVKKHVNGGGLHLNYNGTKALANNFSFIHWHKNDCFLLHFPKINVGDDEVTRAGPVIPKINFAWPCSKGIDIVSLRPQRKSQESRVHGTSAESIEIFNFNPDSVMLVEMETFWASPINKEQLRIIAKDFFMNKANERGKEHHIKLICNR